MTRFFQEIKFWRQKWNCCLKLFSFSFGQHESRISPQFRIKEYFYNYGKTLVLIYLIQARDKIGLKNPLTTTVTMRLYETLYGNGLIRSFNHPLPQIHLDIHFLDNKIDPTSAQKSLLRDFLGWVTVSSADAEGKSAQMWTMFPGLPAFALGVSRSMDQAVALLMRLPDTRVVERPKRHEIISDIANWD